MKRIIACIISAAVLLATASAPGRTLKASGANWQEGVHYERISNDPVGKTADKIEILEFFQYTCPHCYTVEPFVTFLKQRVGDSATVTRVHVVYRPYQRSLARLYYTLQALGRIDSPDRNDVHHDIFDMFHRLGQPIVSENDDESFRLHLEFATSAGIDPEKFTSVYRSPEIDASIKRAQELTRAYKVAGTPTFVVAGKYKPKHVQSERELVTLLSDLVVLAQKR